MVEKFPVKKDESKRIGESYDVKRDEIRKEAPDRRDFVNCYIYKQGKLLHNFMLNDYERYVDKVINEKIIPIKAVLKDNFMENVSKSGYGVEIEIDPKKFDPRWKEYVEKHAKLEAEFKTEILKLYGIENHPKKEDIFSYSVKMAKDGGFYFIEEYMIDLLDLMDIIKKENV